MPVFAYQSLNSNASSDHGVSRENKGQHDNASFRSLVEGKARLNHQHLGQAFGKSCDLMVFGELNSEHAEWATLKNSAGPIFKTSTPTQAHRYNPSTLTIENFREQTAREPRNTTSLFTIPNQSRSIA
ncbi:hypothetical protein HCH_04136 [Hahella chejuensis KCTC 2396]|uniref:Uncharacterized protein n=1 Tax=Hahella chejuensis (strain KCTC 2396) TaxID=349521 RepID=Q2SES8_HAHCH|nr:hypothetical protein HCH_04136 [Hahella chejuensis KCTC 2396]